MKRAVIYATVASATGALLLVSTPAGAHHSVAGVFDVKANPVTASGIVQKVEWVNPHVVIYLDSTDAKGQPVVYALETFAPYFFRRAGVSRNTVSVGAKVAFVGFSARKDPNRIWPSKLTFADGKVLQLEVEDFAASSR